jgi:RNA polymerase sigma factor (sigma-70 family)
MGDEPVTDAAAESRVDDCLGGLLERWQASGDPAQLEAVVVAVRQVVELVAGRTLAECHVADRSAIDDVVSLVLDHLRRLPRGSAGERRVALFRSDDATVGRGLAYIRLLARNRARDVARAHHRRDRHARVFSMLDGTGWQAVSAGEAAARAANDLHEQLLDAVARLEPPLRKVVELLLDGKSQATIAHVLDVCEGTVSRMRKRAVNRLRELLDT